MTSQKSLYGYCSNCGEPLGHFGGDSKKIICYKCAGFSKLDDNSAITHYKNELDKIRIKFRRGLVNGDINRYFANYLEFGEALLRTEDEEYLVISSDKIDSISFIDFNQFVIANIGIKWILEDLNYVSKFGNAYHNSILTLPKKWLIYFQRLVYIENNLGYIIIDENKNEKFYYFEILKFYFDSLNQFGLINPKEIDINKFEEIKLELLEREKDPDYVKEFANIHLPLYFVCMSYAQYPDMNDRIFSFEDISYSPILIDYLGYIIDEYNDKRAKSPEELSIEKEKRYFINIDFNKLKSDVLRIKWDNSLYYFIVASPYNPMSYPLLIEYNGKIIITPTRLKLAREMMFERMFHDTINSYLSIIYENDFQKKIMNLLEEIGCIIKDPVNNEDWIYISDKKNATFEFDLMALYKDYILIIECKSFHPTAFYHLKDAVNRREERVKHFRDQYIKLIIPWLEYNLRRKSEEKFIEINCRTKEVGGKRIKQLQINFPKEFNGINKTKIIGLFITQYKEYFKVYSEISQIYYEDLIDFLKRL